MSPQKGTELIESTAELIIALGDSGFASKLLNQINKQVSLNHISLVHLQKEDQVTYIFSASDGEGEITKAAQQLYLSTYYRFDPNKSFLNVSHETDQIQITRLRPTEITDQDYRQLWYAKMGIVDRLSVLFEEDKGLYCLNLFRTQFEFSDQDIQTIETIAPVLSALAVKHSRLSGRLSSFMTREQQLNALVERLELIDGKLTQREKEVCSRILLGMSSEGIALDLEIKKHSVDTYRKRAYARLNISSQNELFKLCLTTV